MKKILITGAAGFIGFHLARFLQRQKETIEKVIGIDNFNAYYDPKLKRMRQALLEKEGVSIAEVDLCEKEKIFQILKKEKITHVIHLAAQAGVRYSISHPEAYISSNLEGFISLLEACRHFPALKILYASSSSVYGLNDKIPFKESDPTDRPANLYGATKKANELFAYAFFHLYRIPVIGLRYFNVFGPWGRPDMAYFSFTRNILEEREIEVFNGGKMKRDFTYIDDIVQGTVKALDKAQGCEIFNLGNHHPISLLELIETLEKLLGKKAIKKMLPMQKGEILETYADISKSQEKLDYHPSVSFEEGMFRFVTWYQQEYLSLNNCA